MSHTADHLFIYGFRDDAGGQPIGDWSHCGKGGYALCWTWSGSANLSFERIHVGLVLSSSATAVQSGSQVIFGAGMTQETFPGNPYPVDMSELAWRWQPDDASSTDTTPCSVYSGRSCYRTITESGTLTVSAYVNGEHQQQSRHVSVIPCPTGDPVLDDSTIRADLKSLIQRSGPNLPPGDGIAYGDSVGNKRERAGNIYRRPNGTLYFREDSAAAGTECHSTMPKVAPDSSLDVRIAFIHTHPTKVKLRVYGCAPDTTGVLLQRGPWDSMRVPATRGADSTNGGGSRADWTALMEVPENRVLWPSVDEYTINADGEIWKLSALDAFRPSVQKYNRKMWKYDGNTNPSCNW